MAGVFLDIFKWNDYDSSGYDYTKFSGCELLKDVGEYKKGHFFHIITFIHRVVFFHCEVELIFFNEHGILVMSKQLGLTEDSNGTNKRTRENFETS